MNSSSVGFPRTNENFANNLLSLLVDKIENLISVITIQHPPGRQCFSAQPTTSSRQPPTDHLSRFPFRCRSGPQCEYHKRKSCWFSHAFEFRYHEDHQHGEHRGPSSAQHCSHSFQDHPSFPGDNLTSSASNSHESMVIGVHPPTNRPHPQVPPDLDGRGDCSPHTSEDPSKPDPELSQVTTPTDHRCHELLQDGLQVPFRDPNMVIGEPNRYSHMPYHASARTQRTAHTHLHYTHTPHTATQTAPSTNTHTHHTHTHAHTENPHSHTHTPQEHTHTTLAREAHVHTALNAHIPPTHTNNTHIPHTNAHTQHTDTKTTCPHNAHTHFHNTHIPHTNAHTPHTDTKTTSSHNIHMHTRATTRSHDKHAHRTHTPHGRGEGVSPPSPYVWPTVFGGGGGGVGLETSRESLLPPYSPYPPPEGAREFLLTPRPQGQKKEGKRTTRARLPSPHCLSSASPPPHPTLPPFSIQAPRLPPWPPAMEERKLRPPPKKAKEPRRGRPPLSWLLPRSPQSFWTVGSKHSPPAQKRFAQPHRRLSRPPLSLPSPGPYLPPPLDPPPQNRARHPHKPGRSPPPPPLPSIQGDPLPQAWPLPRLKPKRRLHLQPPPLPPDQG